MKICPVRFEMFHADGRMNRQRDRYYKLIVVFRNYANALNSIKRSESLNISDLTKAYVQILTYRIIPYSVAFINL